MVVLLLAFAAMAFYVSVIMPKRMLSGDTNRVIMDRLMAGAGNSRLGFTVQDLSLIPEQSQSGRYLSGAYSGWGLGVYYYHVQGTGGQQRDISVEWRQNPQLSANEVEIVSIFER